MSADALHLSREDARPLVEQLRDRVASGIADGSVQRGTRLPSTRQVADSLGVNRATVVEAYRRLEREGLVETRRGSGTYVRGLPQRAPASGRGSRAAAEVTRSLQSRPAPSTGADTLDLSSLTADEKRFPAEEFAACLTKVLAERGGAALGYGSPAGDQRLREVLAARLEQRGWRVDPSRILVVAGAQQGIDLVFRATLDPGDVALTESPTYHLVLELLRLHRSEVASIPVTPADDMATSRLDLARLAEHVARRTPRLAYSMPTFQNPTGLTLDAASREGLVAACASADVLLVEDDYEAEVRYEGPPSPPLCSMPGVGPHAYVGTLSKALFPGLRVGWVVASPDVLDLVAATKRVADLSGSLLLQAAAAELFASGTYDRHLEERLVEDGATMRAISSGLAQALPRGCRVTRPRGGHAVWVELPAGTPGEDVADRAAQLGVLLTPGELFAPGGATSGLRLSISRLAPKDVGRAVERVALAVSEVVSSHRAFSRRAHVDVPVRT